MKKREAANLVNLARDPAQAIYGDVIAIPDARKALASVSSWWPTISVIGCMTSPIWMSNTAICSNACDSAATR